MCNIKRKNIKFFIFIQMKDEKKTLFIKIFIKINSNVMKTQFSHAMKTQRLIMDGMNGSNDQLYVILR